MENLELFGQYLDDAIKLKGIFEAFDGLLISLGLEQGVQALQDSHPELLPIIDDLMGAIVTENKDEIVRISGQLMAEILLIIINDKKE